MPYNANFSVTQSIDCTTITITDTSSNPDDELIIARKLYLQKADGTYISPASQEIISAPNGATGSFKFASVPSVSTVISVDINDLLQGLVSIPYTVTSGDTTVDILSANVVLAIEDALPSYTVSYNSTTDVITMVTPAGYGANMNYSGSGSGVGNLVIYNATLSNTTKFAGGSDGTISTGTGLDYYEFSPFLFPSNEITINLAQDYALSIQMISTPSVVVTGSVYDVAKEMSFVCNLETFRLARISDLSSVPNIINDQNFRSSLYDLSLEIDNAGIAIEAGDVQSSQAAIDRGYYLVNNQNNFF